MRIGIASGDRIPASKSYDGQEHWGGAGWVRLMQYASRLEEQGVEIYGGILVWNRDHFSIDVADGAEVLVDVDIVYIQRLMHDGLATHIKQAQAYGQVVINDLDDWYWGLDTSNSAFDSSHPKLNPKENTNHYKKVLNASSVVTVSTPYLADRIKSFVHCPIVLLENTVDVGRFTVHEHTDSNVPVVGWVGSTNHRSGDLEVLRGVVNPLYDNGEIKLQHSGAHLNSPTASSKWGVPDEAVLNVPACDPQDYPNLLTMDIGIAPLRDTPFNHAKSDIKLLEYSSAGIPWIASSLSAYNALNKEWGLGRLAKKPLDWQKHIRALKDPNARATEGNALREAVWQRDIGVGTKRLLGFLESLL